MSEIDLSKVPDKGLHEVLGVDAHADEWDDDVLGKLSDDQKAKIVADCQIEEG